MGFLLGLLAVAAVIVVVTGVRIVPQAKVMVIERLGRFHRVCSSGLNIIIPIVDAPRAIEMRVEGRYFRSTLVDLREQVMGFETVQVITHDNVAMEVGSVIYYQIIDPVKALYEIENLGLAIEQLTMTNLRNVMGGLTLDQTLTSRDTINAKLRQELDAATEKWGVKVTRVELREIEPPREIKEAMAKQMTAERERRAEVTRAEGDKAAAILSAEGDKTSRILRAEAERDALIAQAEGRKRAQMLEAEGQAEATRLIFEAIHNGRATPEVLALKYLETLGELGKGPNKLFVPYEATAALGSLGALRELFEKEGAAPQVQAQAQVARPPARAAIPARPAAPDAAPGVQTASAAMEISSTQPVPTNRPR